MDVFENPLEIASLVSMILLLLLSSNRALSLAASRPNDEEVFDDFFRDVQFLDTASADLDVATRAALHQFRLFNSYTVIDEDLGFWVKPRSTTWFSRFLLQEYDDSRWVQMFRMTKRSIFTLTQLLGPAMKKQDTKYRLAIPVTVRIACTLFKLSHGASLLICSEMFALGRSTVSLLLRDVVHAINVALRGEISWPSGDHAQAVASDFQDLCGLPGVLGAIDGTYIGISKPRVAAADYFYFKSGGYSINCQAAVDSSKRFLDLYVGMLGSTNDSRMLRRSSLFARGQRRTLWDANLTFSGFSPYLLGDGGYPLLPWLMVPHRHEQRISVADSLFNRRLSKGRCIVENAFAFLKLSFRELHQKSALHVNFLPDVVFCCCILHNILLKQTYEEVERLLEILRREEHDRMEGCAAPVEEVAAAVDVFENVANVGSHTPEAQNKRRALAVHVSLQRIVPA